MFQLLADLIWLWLLFGAIILTLWGLAAFGDWRKKRVDAREQKRREKLGYLTASPERRDPTPRRQWRHESSLRTHRQSGERSP